MLRTHPLLHLFRNSVALLILAACQNAQSTQPTGYCTAAYSPAVVVTAEDSTTRANLAMGSRGVVRNGTYSDSLRRVDSVLWGGARLGTYDVAIERQGIPAVDPQRRAGHARDGLWHARVGASHRALTAKSLAHAGRLTRASS